MFHGEVVLCLCEVTLCTNGWRSLWETLLSSVWQKPNLSLHLFCPISICVWEEIWYLYNIFGKLLFWLHSLLTCSCFKRSEVTNRSHRKITSVAITRLLFFVFYNKAMFVHFFFSSSYSSQGCDDIFSNWIRQWVKTCFMARRFCVFVKLHLLYFARMLLLTQPLGTSLLFCLRKGKSEPSFVQPISNCVWAGIPLLYETMLLSAPSYTWMDMIMSSGCYYGCIATGGSDPWINKVF